MSFTKLDYCQYLLSSQVNYLTFPHEIRQYHQAEAGKVGAARDEEPAVVPLATASPRT